MRRLLALAVLLAWPPAAHAQTADAQVTLADDVRLHLGATAQLRATYAYDDTGEDTQQRLGFGIRRLFVRAALEMGPRLNLFLQANGASSSVTLLDIRLGYLLSENTEVRAGRFLMAQPAAFGYTPHLRLDAVERPIIAQRWASTTVGPDARDFGVELFHARPGLRASVALHNGDGSWDRLGGNYREDVGLGSPTGGIDRTGLALSGAVAYELPGIDGLEVGAYAGANSAEGPRSEVGGIGRGYASYAAHVYWGAVPGSQPVRLKLDVIGIHYEEVELPAGAFQQHLAGGALFGAVRVHRAAEAFARVGVTDDDVNAGDGRSTFLTVGGSFSGSALAGGAYHRTRLTLAWIGRLDEGHSDLRVHGLTLQAQAVF